MKQEEIKLLLEDYFENPSQQALNQLIEAYLPFAKHIAKRFAGRGVDIEDLEHVASIGLLKAVQRFEPDRGIQFTSYATPTIVGDLRNYIRDKGNIVRLPREAKNKLYHLEKARDAFYQTHFREPSFEELAEGMGMTIEEILQLLEFREKGEVFSLEASIDDQSENTFSFFVGEEDQGFDRVEKADWLSWIYSMVNPREKQLLQLRYEQELGQRETARYMGVSQMQISRMERKLLDRLRSMEKSTQRLYQ